MLNRRGPVAPDHSARDQLAGAPAGGRQATRRMQRSLIFLATDAGAAAGSARRAQCYPPTVTRTRGPLTEGGRDRAWAGDPRPGAERTLSFPPPGEAWRILRRTEVHHPPVHASWPARAAIESTVLQGQGLQHRIPDRDMPESGSAAREMWRHDKGARIPWMVTTGTARVKLARACLEIDGEEPESKES